MIGNPLETPEGVNLPAMMPEDIEIEIEHEVQPDGSVTIEFESEPAENEDFTANLVESIDNGALGRLCTNLVSQLEDDL